MSIEAARLSVGVDTSDVDQADRKLRNLGDTVGSTGSLMRTAGATAAGFLGAQAVQSIVGAGAAMFTLGSQTQDMLNQFQAVSGVDTSGLKEVQQLARSLGNDLTLPATSAKDATEAMLELNKAGLSVSDTMAAAKGTLQLSAAAGTDAATAATITANALNMFGLKGDQAGRVADILAAAANTSSGSIQDMAYALQMSGTVAAQAGIPIETLTAMIGEMANKGIMGSDAGTSLKTMIMSLEAPSNKAKSWLDAWGISLYDNEGKMKSMTDIVGQFQGVLKNGVGGEAMTQDVWAQGMSTIFGTDAIRAANVVMGEGVDGLNQMTTAVTKQGAAQEVAAAKMKGVGGAIAGLQSELETLAIDGFNAVAPAAEIAVRWIADELPKGIETAKNAIKTFIDAARPIVTWVTDFVQANPIPVLAGLGAVVATVIVPAFAAWAAEMIITVGPVLALVAAVGLLVGGVVYAYQHFETFRDVVNAVVGAVQTVVGGLVDWWQAHWDQISEATDHVMNVIRDLISAGIAVVKGIWQHFGDDILTILKSAWDLISGLVQSAMEIVRGVIQTVLALINGDWGQAWDGIKGILGGVWDGIKTVVSSGVEGVKGILGGIVEFILTLPLKIAVAAVGMFDGLLKAAKDIIVDIVHEFSQLPGKIMDALPDWAQKAVGAAGWITGVTPITKGVGFVKGIFGAEGGIATRPTPGIFGEAGPEALIPLSRAGEFGLGSGGSRSGDTYVTVQIDATNSYIDPAFASTIERHLVALTQSSSLTARGVRV